MSIQWLPAELLVSVLAFLSPESLPLAVSRDFYAAGTCDLLWWEFFFRRWPRRRLRDGRIPAGRYGVTEEGWRQRFKRKLQTVAIDPVNFVVIPSSFTQTDAETLHAVSFPPPCSSSEEEISEEEDETLPFLKRCYYAGYSRAMAEEVGRKKTKTRQPTR